MLSKRDHLFSDLVAILLRNKQSQAWKNLSSWVCICAHICVEFYTDNDIQWDATLGDQRSSDLNELRTRLPDIIYAMESDLSLRLGIKDVSKGGKYMRNNLGLDNDYYSRLMILPSEVDEYDENPACVFFFSINIC